jgi:hypothetical protein
MIFSPNTIRNSAFAEPFLKQYRKQKLNLLSSTYWLDKVGDYSGTQHEKSVLRLDGINGFLDFGNIGTINTVTLYIKQEIDNQEILTVNGGTTGGVKIALGVITVGSAITISNIFVDDISRTATGAGVILNNNKWHKLKFTITGGVAATAFEIGTDGSGFGQLLLANVETETLNCFFEETTGTIAFDSLGNSNNGTLTGGVTHDEIRVFIKFKEFDLDDIVFGNAFSTGNATLTVVGNNTINFSTGSKSQIAVNFLSEFENGDIIKLNITQTGATLEGGLINILSGGTGVMTLDGVNIGFSNGENIIYLIITDTTKSVIIRDGDNVGSPNYSVVINSVERAKFSLINQTNFLGYSNGTGGNDGKIIPIDLSDITKDILGNPLDFSGRVASDMTFVQSNCLEINNTSDYGQLDFDLTGVTITSFEGTATASIDETNNRILFSGGVGTFYNLILSNGLKFAIAEGLGFTSYAENDQTKQIIWNGGESWALQDTYHNNITQGFTEGVNMLKYSNDFSNSVWVKTGISSALSDIIVMDTSNEAHRITQGNLSLTLGTSYAMQFKAKKVDADWVTFNFHNLIDVNYRFIYQFSSNTFTYQDSSFTSLTATVQDDGFVLLKATIVATHTYTDANIAIGLSLDGEIDFTGDGTSSMKIKDGQFEKNTIVTYYQETTTQSNEGIKLPYKIAGAYSNAATNGHNQAETKLKQVVFREDFGASSLHFDQSDLSSKVITYADIANTANVFVNQFPNVKINLETFFPSGIINQSNRQNNGLRRNKDTFFGNNK